MGLSMVTGQAIFDKPAASQTAGACSAEIKQALKDNKWALKTEFSNGANTWTATTAVAADGAITIKTRRRGPFKVRCDGKEISFDWRNDESKRYTLTLQKDGNFEGSRSGSNDDYGATLKKKN
jgi:hypothetical protein